MKALGYNVDEYFTTEAKPIRQIQTCFTDVTCTPSTEGGEGKYVIVWPKPKSFIDYGFVFYSTTSTWTYKIVEYFEHNDYTIE